MSKLICNSLCSSYVTENNSKFANRIIAQLKAYAKAQGFNSSYDPYKAAYKNMPSHASANPAIKQLYINGHFCYVYKFGIVTNGLGIARDITFYNKDFFDAHPVLLHLSKLKIQELFHFMIKMEKPLSVVLKLPQ